MLLASVRPVGSLNSIARLPWSETPSYKKRMPVYSDVAGLCEAGGG